MWSAICSSVLHLHVALMTNRHLFMYVHELVYNLGKASFFGRNLSFIEFN